MAMTGSWKTLAAVLFASALSVIGRCEAAPAATARCKLAAFLSTDSDWQARTFEGQQIPWTQGAWPQPTVFTPLQALFVRNGKVYAATWQTEPVRATSKVEGEGIRIEPQFAVWLPGIDSANNRDAKRVAPYADAKVRHVLSVANACKRSPSIEVVITLADGRTQRVTLAKLPTSPAVFEDPEA
jgi:hypothetical protein